MARDAFNGDPKAPQTPSGRRLVCGTLVAFFRRIPATAWIPLATGLLRVGNFCYQFSLPLVLFGIHGYTGNGYDDGVYLGAATRLVHGVLPYRDFDFVQPPESRSSWGRWP